MRPRTSLILHPKEKEVLELFLSQEDKGATGDLNYSVYHPHPARVSIDVKISRKHAKNVCENFVNDIKIFSFKLESTRNKVEKTRHYFLKKDFSTFRTLVKIILENYDLQRRIELLNCVFIRRFINADLVRRILAEKKIIISRSVDILNWKNDEAHRFFHEVYHDPPDPINFFPIKSFQEYARLAATEDYIGGIVCRSGPVEYLHLRFPVRTDKPSQLSKIEDVIKFHNFSLDHLPNLKENPSAILDYYSINEYEEVILPLLALVLISPRALNDFINPDGVSLHEMRNPDYVHDGMGELRFPFLFELVFTAIEDIVKTRKIPENGEVAYAEVNPTRREKNPNNSVLEIHLKSGYVIRYRINFNTLHDPKSAKPEDLQYKIDIDTGIEPFGEITYNTRPKSITDIRDPTFIFSSLRADENVVSHYLRGKFTSRFNNILSYIDLDHEIPQFQIVTLLKELNRVIVRNDLSQEEAFKHLLDCEDPFCSLRTIPRLPDHLRWIDFDEKTWNNFILIVKAFPEAFKTISREEFEKMLNEMNPRRRKKTAQ